jgi:membrane protein
MLDDISKDDLKIKIKAGYRQADSLSQGTLGILVRAIQTFAEADAATAAASIAYYALFSLFPLLLFLVTIGSSVLQSERVEQEVLDFTATALPISQELVERNIEEVLARRGTVRAIAAVGLLWAATGVFTILARNINKAWHSARPRNFLQRRLLGLIIVSVLGGLLILSLISTTIFKLLPWLDAGAPLWGGVSLYETLTWKVATRLVPWFFTFVTFFGLYRWIPNTEVRWSEAVWGALVATVGWEITKSGFAWYLGSGLAEYDLVYGSLGALVALMLWIYLSSLVLLFGAHFSAAISHSRQSSGKKD